VSSRRTASLRRCIHLLHTAAVAAEEAEMWRQEETGWDAAGSERAERTTSAAASDAETAAAACAEHWRLVRKAQHDSETEAALTPASDSDMQQIRRAAAAEERQTV
jgi:hypothetical protein